MVNQAKDLIQHNKVQNIAFHSMADCMVRVFGQTPKIMNYPFAMNIYHGAGMIKDLRKRLANALKDAQMDNSKVEHLINWLENNYKYFPINDHSGWLSVFLIHKKVL